MSTAFRPLQLPPGVVAQPTKKVPSANYAEANLVRWVEGSFVPVGGQERYSYSIAFASPIRKIHGWTDNAGIYHVAYLCEHNVYVDTGGTLVDITPSGGMVVPDPDPTLGGYGDGAYGSDPGVGDAYGTGRHTGGEARQKTPPYWYSMDNWGQQLLCMTSADGRLLFWDPTGTGAGLILQAVPTSPTGRGFVVTPDRFVIMFGITSGGGSFRRIGWCDQENYSDWNFASTTNKAGFYDLEPASPIMTAINGKNGILFWTARKAYVLQYVGLPYIYSKTELSDDCTPWSPASVTNTSMQMMWVSEQGVWTFDGTQITPVQCTVRDWINDDVDKLFVRQQAVAVHLGEFSEFWWFFPQNGQHNNTRCVIYNYREGWWSQGQMARSAGMTSDYSSFTIMANGTTSYKHESGTAYPDGTPLPWAETFVMNVGSGAMMSTFKQLQPDVDGDSTSIGFQLYYKNDRTDKTVEKVSDVKMINSNGFVDFRKTARDFRLRILCVGPTVPPITLGQHLVDITQRGDR